jgi:hypothetical protein
MNNDPYLFQGNRQFPNYGGVFDKMNPEHMADAVLGSVIPGFAREKARKQRLHTQQIHEALRRLNFTVNDQGDMLNVQGQPLGAGDKVALVDEVKLVMAESELYRIKLEDEQKAAQAKLEAGQKAHDDAQAKPFREARAKRAAEKMAKGHWQHRVIDARVS